MVWQFADGARPTMSDFDNPWKDVLEHFFHDFLAFFCPNVYAAIDWNRKYESLDCIRPWLEWSAGPVAVQVP
jgi:hypothetical protein